MAHYSDPQHALLARIAKALERIADSLEKQNPAPTINEENR
jgi:hypothetical protein